MTWFSGTVTGHEALSDEIRQLATGTSLTATIAAAGTLYSVGDILTVSGGTFFQEARFEVTSVDGGGGVTGIRQAHGGSYSVVPGNPAATTVSPAGGSGCTLTVTGGSTGWTEQRALTQLGPTTVTINAGGTGYSVNDIITVSGGTFTTAATLRVLAESAGVITDIAIEDPGEYTVAPSPLIGVATTGGNADATVDLVFNGSVGRKEVILEGSGGGADQIFVGWKTYTNLPTSARNWEMAGMDGFSAGLPWTSQPNKSPGEWDDQGTFFGGAFFLLSDSAIDYWASITPFRIIVIAKVGATYSSCHVGWLNRFGTATEIPYPMYIAANTALENAAFSDGNIEISGIGDPIAETNPGVSPTSRGPAMLRLTNGSYITVANSYEQSNSRTAYYPCGVYPGGQPVSSSPASSPVDLDDQIVNNGFFNFNNLIPNAGNPGVIGGRLKPTPNTGGDLAWLIPCTVYVSGATIGLQFYGEIDGLYWCSGNQGSVVISEDTFSEGTDRYFAFQSSLRTDTFAFYCIKEE